VHDRAQPRTTRATVRVHLLLSCELKGHQDERSLTRRRFFSSRSAPRDAPRAALPTSFRGPLRRAQRPSPQLHVTHPVVFFDSDPGQSIRLYLRRATFGCNFPLASRRSYSACSSCNCAGERLLVQSPSAPPTVFEYILTATA
jgi:hypothetical protein